MYSTQLESGHIQTLDMESTVYQWNRLPLKMVHCIFHYAYSYLSLCLFSAPSGYPTDLVVNTDSPNTVILGWGSVPEIDQNGVITEYEVLYSQDTIDHLPQSGTVTSTEMSATVGPLQPFIPYNLTVRAYTSSGAGPFNQMPTTTTITDSLGNT